MSAPWAALANAIAEGITLAAETICPRDHVGERRHRAVVDALAGEPALSDDELVAVRGLIQEGYDTPPGGVVNAEIHCDGCQCPVYCGCGREIYEVESPDGPVGSTVFWVHDDDTPACVIHRDDPGEDDADPPTAPSPGDRSDLPLIDALRARIRAAQFAASETHT